ncbi:hypothetical protein [Halostagnicola kamekurae]|uniref:Uncharacterized protein n=1 Tax=Halostagnicola kamekurae TaxID=619731 RepID=A0A1I6RFH9_9EURY|nr:hypothetical protein [Halostagnicola kamekurae]SFS63426.1 hypothetical protein SAMN04488556_1756 [Halostagnicola kamekurae]
MRAAKRRSIEADHLESEAQDELRIQREAQAVTAPETELRADGGEADTYTANENAQLEIAKNELEYPPVDVGDHVQDREDIDATMVVVRTPLEPANEVDARNGKTVAESNPGYPADDDVVVVKFPERTSTDIGPLQGYAFPRTRLEIVARVHDRNDDQEVSE